jgi:hypothetical protein
MIPNTACFLELSQYNLTIQSKNLIDLDFDSFTDVAVSNSYIDLVERDTFHPSLVVDMCIPLPCYAQSLLSFRNYASGEAENILECTAVFLIECRPTFQRYILPP